MGALTLGAILTGPGLRPADAGEPATGSALGTASAIAQSYKVNPTTASLSIGITFGTSLAGYTNNVAQSESRALDLGIIGTTLAAQGCDGGAPTLPARNQPQAIHADSRDPGAGTTKSEQESFAPVITKSVEADSSPNGLADTVTAALSAKGSPISIAAAHSQALVHIVNGVREAVATTDIGGVTIAGVLELSGLHWTATYRTGATDATDGGFSIGAIKVLGQKLPNIDVLGSLEQANGLLAPLGVQFVTPKAHVEAGILFVDPLSIRIVPSQTRDSITGGILGAIQPVRQNLYDALLAQDCGNATYITVSDIAIGSITGAGSLSLDLGGVQASSAALKTTSFLNGLIPPLPSLGDITNNLPSLSNTPIADLPPVSNKPAPVVKNNRRNSALAANVDGSRGGKLALVGAIGLLALLFVADRDRRLMRRAQKLTSEV